MRGKDFSTGLRGGLFEQQHCARMGTAIWLYGWLVLRQTNQKADIGWVLGGKPISYREIEEETGFNRRTLERWMRDLRRAGYIQTSVVPAGVVVRITKAKKFPQHAEGVRGPAGGVRRLAEGRPQSCVAGASETFVQQQFTDGIGSGFKEREIENQTKSEIHRDFHNPKKNQRGQLKPNPSLIEKDQNPPSRTRNIPPAQQYRQLFIEAIRRRELLRAEREEELRRELAVGTGPELQRS
jgi:hypothetical protein